MPNDITNNDTALGLLESIFRLFKYQNSAIEKVNLTHSLNRRNPFAYPVDTNPFSELPRNHNVLSERFLLAKYIEINFRLINFFAAAVFIRLNNQKKFSEFKMLLS